MNRRQRKKQLKQLTVIVRCDMLLKQKDAKKIGDIMQRNIEKSNLLILPPYMHLEGIIKGARTAQLIIKPLSEVTESEGKNELQAMEKEIQKDARLQSTT